MEEENRDPNDDRGRVEELIYWTTPRYASCRTGSMSSSRPRMPAATASFPSGGQRV